MAIFISIPYKEQLLTLNYSDNELLMLENELNDIQQLEFLINHHQTLTEFFSPQQITTILCKNLSFPLLLLSIDMIKQLNFPKDEFYCFLITDIEVALKLTLLGYVKKHSSSLVLTQEQLLNLCQTENPMHRLKFLMEKGKELIENYFLRDDLFTLISTNQGFQNLKKYLSNISKFIGYSSGDLKFVILNAHKLDCVLRFQEFFGKQMTFKELIELLNFRKFNKTELELFFDYLDALMKMGFSKTQILEIYYTTQEPLILDTLLSNLAVMQKFGFSLAQVIKIVSYEKGSTYLRAIIGLNSIWSLSEYHLLKPSDITEIVCSNRALDDFRQFLDCLGYLKQFVSIVKIIQLAKIDCGVSYLKLLVQKIQLLVTKGVDNASLVQACQTTKQDQILDFLISNFNTIRTLNIPEKNLLDLIQGSLNQGKNKDEAKFLKKIIPFLIKMERFSSNHMVDLLGLLIKHRDQHTLEKFMNYAEQLKAQGFSFDQINQVLQPEHSKPNIILLINYFHLLEKIGLNHQSISTLISSRDGFNKLTSLLKSMEMIEKFINPTLLKPMFCHFQLSDYPQIAAGFYINLKKEIDFKSLQGTLEQYESLKVVHLSKEQILEHLQLALMQVKVSNKHLTKNNKLPERLRRLLNLGISVDQIQWLETINNSHIVRENIIEFGYYLYDLKFNALQILEFFFKKSDGPLTDFPFEKLKSLTKPPLNLNTDKLYQLMMVDDFEQLIGLIQNYFTRFKSLAYEINDFIKLIVSVKHINQIIEPLYRMLPHFLQFHLSLDDIRVIAYWTQSQESFYHLKKLLEDLSLAGIAKGEFIKELVRSQGQLNYPWLIQQLPLFKELTIPLNEIIELTSQYSNQEELQYKIYDLCLGQSLGLSLYQIEKIAELTNGRGILQNLATLAIEFKKLGFEQEQIVPVFMKHQERDFLKSLLDNLPCLFAEPYLLNRQQVYRILMADNFGYCISVTTRYFPQWHGLGLDADKYLDFIINKPQLLAIADELFSLIPHFLRSSFLFDDILACGKFINSSGEFGKLFYIQSLLGVLGFSKKEFVERFVVSRGQINLDTLSLKLPLFNGLGLSFSLVLDWIERCTDDSILLKNLENLKLNHFGLTTKQQKSLKSLPNSALIIENLLTVGQQFKAHHFSMEQILYIFKKFIDLNELINIAKEYFVLLNPPYKYKPEQLFSVLCSENHQECCDLIKLFYPSLNFHGLRTDQFLMLIINKPDAKMLVEEFLNLTPKFLENQVSMPEIWDIAWYSKNAGDLGKFFVVFKSLLKMGIAKNELLEEFKDSQGQLPLELIQKKLALFKTANLTFKQMLVLIDEYPSNQAIKKQLGKRDISSLSLFKSTNDEPVRKHSNCESRLV